MSHHTVSVVLFVAVAVYFVSVFLLLLLNRDYRDAGCGDRGPGVRS